MRTSLVIGLLAALLWGCNQTPSQSNNFEQIYNSIDINELKQHTRVLASDEFEGRLPTTIGEEKTLAYLTKHFTELGYQPGNGSSFLQAVELTEITADPDMTLTLGSERFDYKKNMVAGTSRSEEQVDLVDSELVFVGYGVNAPEYNWNDYANIDVAGKTVVILVNDPGFAAPDSGLFQGKTMTYYGRWTYKYEEASRQGAAAAIIVHETAPASYGWSVVANSWSGPQYGLVSPDGNKSRVGVEGWISVSAAKKVFANAGLDFTQLKAKALAGPFSQAIDATASVTVKSTVKTSTSYNFIATFPGSKYPDEHLIYTAHWDHLGKDTSLIGDQIYNGAHDNATGTAALLTLAKAYKNLASAPERSVTFLIVTAEEQGLLGSKYYSLNPIIAMDKTVANLNLDAMNVLGKTKDVSVVGFGKSELEVYLTAAAKRQGRYLVQEGKPGAGYYYRSDHFNFAKNGVPALYAGGGEVPWDEATAKYRKRAKVIVTGCYHQTCDQFREKWDFGGVLQDSQLAFDVGFHIANSRDWPKWNKTSEFQRKQ